MKKIAIILAAGKNSRIKSICYDRPKCLLSVCGQTLINRLINQFTDYVDEFYVAAGSNASKIASVLPHSSNIHILDFCGKDFRGNGATLQHSIREIIYTDASVVILESDIVLSDAAVKKFTSDNHPLKFISVDKEMNLHDDAIIKTEAGYRFTKERNPNWEILGKYIGVTELIPSILEKIEADTNVPEHYAEFISRYSSLDFQLIGVSIEEAMEIDNEKDYSYVLNNYHIKPTTERFDPYELHIGQGLQTFVGVYDVIGAKIARQYGIDGLYLGSYQISSSIGKKDDKEFHIKDALSVAKEIRYANINMPIILDGMGGLDNDLQDIDIISQAITDYRISGICIDDIKDSHTCSMNKDFKPELLSIEDFEKRISFARKYLGTKCKIIARTEIMNISDDKCIIQKRIKNLQHIDADILLPHYVGGNFQLLEESIKGISSTLPLMIIPSRLLKITKKDWSELGYQYLVYANLDIRLRTYVLEDLYEQISTANVINDNLSDIHKLKDVYDFG
ncbi:MAG: isocitrate lyase/phosphoenolpyruvate mutase family protein [Lachnospiraceae bacterium]|nr:isocitrate lyase/phosphoenolpyruvate mutase family protein [Lachnospiraceae bacterium]